AEHGLFIVQKKYFDSLFLIHRLFGFIPIPLPGVTLLMGLLFVNLVCGAIIRAPKSWRAPGMLIAHSGILILLAAGFVCQTFSTDGYLRLYEQESSDEFQSYHDWVIEIRQHTAAGDGEPVWVIPTGDLQAIRPGAAHRFFAESIPFDLTVSRYLNNCVPVRAVNAHGDGVDGLAFEARPLEKEAEFNIAGALVTLRDKSSGKAHPALLWGQEKHPFVLDVEGDIWSVGLTRRTWRMPFSIHLDKFTVERHPNTEIARVYQSDVTRIEGAVQEQVKISMNKPLRYRGYTLFQATWGPQGAPEGTPLFSGFAVVRNPSDYWPLYSCIVVGAGLLIHLVQKLLFFLKRRPA
ncbi:MAG: cytochrome c biogenesis protein ResB, partial [Verrucomicrobia bacterium]|nr:cytochrome c biogenesis protein ResB [Verrucomicrobiota bacterium]